MNRGYRIRGVLFDFDGTLTRPESIDFDLIRQLIGCPPEKLILEYIDALSDEAARREALATVDRCEMDAAGSAVPNDGAEAVVTRLRSLGIKVGILSRNSSRAIARSLTNFEAVDTDAFDLIISRDDPFPPKPDPAGILYAADSWGVVPEEILVVGDVIFDIEAAVNAGSLSAFITNGDSGTVPEDADFTVASLSEVMGIVKKGVALQGGKLPQDLLDDFLGAYQFSDSSVLNWPGIGEDTSAVDAAEEEVIVVTSDPITFATDAIGEYAVLVNANDIVTSGGTPRWFLTTLLFPLNTTASEIGAVMAELASVCKRIGVTLCGGHTEITDAVSRTIVNGMMIGSVRRERLLDKKAMHPGDRILLTKGVAIEGTALIAREFGRDLLAMGVDEELIERAQAFLSRISVIEEGRIAAGIDGVAALHDITEGGVATALEEFAIAGEVRIEVPVESLPLLPETVAVCAPFDIDPLGLIGSGGLLICCRSDSVEQLQGALESAGLDAAVVGTAVEGEPGIVALRGNEIVAWPRFDVDEITRLFKK